MEIKRTANSGVLLIMDNVKILLDGVCKAFSPYLGTPDEIRQELESNLPDILAFTHTHADHYDALYEEHYKKMTKKAVYSPQKVCSCEEYTVKFKMIETRHIGKSDVPHVSYVFEGSKCVWFMGDVSPLSLKEFKDLKKPDVLIAPYSFANTVSGWRAVNEIGAEKIIILHLPDKAEDEYGLWDAVLKTAGNDTRLIIPDIGERILI